MELGNGKWTGYLRTFPRDVVRMNLLPRKDVSVTQHGIHFGHQLYYTCETAMKEAWFPRARIKGSWKISIAYHPHSTRHIYVPTNNGKDMEVCELTSASKYFEHSDYYSVENYYFEEAIASEDAQDRIINSNARFNALHDQITKEASEKKELAVYDEGKQSNSELLGNIRENRREERDLEREKNEWKIRESEVSNFNHNSHIEDSEEKEENNYIPSPDYTELLEQLLNKQKKEGENK